MKFEKLELSDNAAEAMKGKTLVDWNDENEEIRVTSCGEPYALLLSADEAVQIGQILAEAGRKKQEAARAAGPVRWEDAPPPKKPGVSLGEALKLGQVAMERGQNKVKDTPERERSDVSGRALLDQAIAGVERLIIRYCELADAVLRMSAQVQAVPECGRFVAVESTKAENADRAVLNIGRLSANLERLERTRERDMKQSEED